MKNKVTIFYPIIKKMSNSHNDNRGTLGHPCRPSGGDMGGVPCDYPLVCHASGGDTGGVKMCVNPSTPMHLIPCSGSTGQNCPDGYKCMSGGKIGAPGHCIPNLIPAHHNKHVSLMTCGPSGQKCPPNFKCVESSQHNQKIGAPGHCVPLKLGPGGQHHLGGFSYQCTDGLGCHLVQEPASVHAGRFSNYQQCEKSCSVPTHLQTYYRCDGKQGVACTGPYPGFPDAKRGLFASKAECQEGTICGKPVVVKPMWPEWDTGVGGSNPFVKIMSKTGDIHDPIQNYMGEPAPGPQRTHMWRPGRDQLR